MIPLVSKYYYGKCEKVRFQRYLLHVHLGRVLVQVLALGRGQPRVVLGAAVPELEPETEPEQPRGAEQVEQRVPGAPRQAQDQPAHAH